MSFQFKFEELIVYQEALTFIDKIYIITNNWPKDELFGLTNQIRRASSSIALNLAEGSSRSKKDFCHFLDIAKGSCYECVTILTIAKKRRYIDEQTYNQLYEGCAIAAKKISKLRLSILPSNN